jgi:CBS domain containing-hemolysin-like protein
MQPDTINYLPAFLLLIFLLASNAFFVISEFAFVSSRKSKIFNLAQKGDKRAKIINNFLEKPDIFIASVQLGVTLSSIGTGWVGEAYLAKFLTNLFYALPAMEKNLLSHSIATIVSFGAVTIFLVVLGELVPKSIALHHAESIALAIARPIKFFTILFTPGVFVLNRLAKLVLKLFKVPLSYESFLSHSIEELRILINASHQEGIIKATEKDILQNVFKMPELMAKHAMRPRPDMVCVPETITPEEMEQLISKHQYTRYPVYKDNIDTITGIAHIKGIYPLFFNKEDFNIARAVKEAILIPETTTIDNLLMHLKRKQSHMAIVVDEFGVTSGLITIEDILEEIFGEVQDEYDIEEPSIKKISDTEFLISAMVRIDEINELFGTNISEHDVDTTGGLIMKKLGRLAQPGEMVQIENLLFTVKEVDGPRIIKLRLEKQTD